MKKTKPPKKSENAAVEPEQASVTPAPVTAEPAPEAAKEEPKKGGSPIKTWAVVLLLAIVIVLAYYFINLPSSTFVPGTAVDLESFKQIFLSATKVYIVMDVRGVTDSVISHNILQCGVDFAGSNGMGGKDVTYISLSGDGCFASDNNGDKLNYTVSDCLKNLKNGITVYVKQAQGNESVGYYSNGMVVPLGTNYTSGGCSITRS